MPDLPDPPPYLAAHAGNRAANLRRARIVLGHARDSAGRAGRPALRRIVAGATRAMRAEVASLAAGNASPAAWFHRSVDQLAVRHYAAALALAGGRPLTPDALDAVETAINAEAGRLARMRQQLNTIPTAKALKARAGNYGRAVWATAMNAQRAASNAPRERRVMGASERHCGVCPDLESLGWQPAGTLPAIGDTPCATGCHCHFEFRGGAAAADPSDLRFAPPEAAAGDALVAADLGRLLASLAASDPRTFVGPGGTGAAKPGAYANAAAFLARARARGIPFETPRVGLDAAGAATVIDGRHRLAALAAAGFRRVPVAVDPASAAAFRRRYGPR